jgi:hypothetical protein
LQDDHVCLLDFEHNQNNEDWIVKNLVNTRLCTYWTLNYM